MFIVMLCLSLSLVFSSISSAFNDEWIVLFDGSSTKEWRTEHGDSFPRRGWTVDERDKALVCQYGGNLVSKRAFSSFELRFEFRINPGGNSGVFYLYDEDRYDALEYQILDDLNHGDGKNPTRSLAALYDVLAPDAENKIIMRAGNWNTGRILVKDRSVEHWLNGQLVLKFKLDSDEFRKAVSQSKFKDRPGFARNQSGHILLQDHRDVVSFRRIYIRPLSN